MISFIIPAKNVSDYIEDCLSPFQEVYHDYNFEVIIIDDHSTDDTFAKVSKIALQQPKIKIFKNQGSGKVQALNFGFALSKGQIIKCIDSDDVLLKDIFPILINQAREEATMHDILLVDSKLNRICYFASNPDIITSSFEDTVKKILSPPRCVWSFSRSIACKIFPMPDIPYEDVWFAFSIKKYAERIIHCRQPLYLYRQHSAQIFGGVMNFSQKIVRFRANRIMKLLPVIKNSDLGNTLPSDLFDENIKFFTYISDNKWSVKSYLKLRTSARNKIRFFLILFFPKLTQRLLIILWKFRLERNRFMNKNQLKP